MKTLIAAAAAASMMLGGAHAASILIDDFDQGLTTGLSLSGLAESNSASDVYNQFDRTITVSSDFANGSNISIGLDLLTINSGNLGSVEGEIRWELTDTSGGLDLTNSKNFESTVLNNSVSSSTDSVDLHLTLVSGIDSINEQSFTYDFVLNQGDGLLQVAISNFVGQVDLSDVDAIVLSYESNQFQGVDLSLEGSLITTAIPVPGALPLMLAGIGFYAASRTRRVS